MREEIGWWLKICKLEREREREETVRHRNLRHQIYQKLKNSMTKSIYHRWKMESIGSMKT
jgi:hypothetical protein